MQVSLAELESMAISAGLDSLVAGNADPTMWIRFEAEVRSAHAAAATRLRQQGGERCVELLRLLEHEEQTRCQAFQGALMGEVHGPVYQATVRSILEKLLAKLETCSYEPTIYRGAAQCLSEYMSALNHHCDTCAVPSPSDDLNGLGAIAEAAGESEFLDTVSVASAESIHSDSTHSSLRSGGVQSIASSDNQGAHPLSHPSTAETGAPLAVVATLEAKPHAEAAAFAGHTLPHVMSGGAPVLSLGMNDELRKQRRREANRSASVKYRSKKTATLSTMMSDNAALRQQVASLSSQAAVLSAENKLLKQQVSFMQGILQGQPKAQQQLAEQMDAPMLEGGAAWPSVSAASVSAASAAVSAVSAGASAAGVAMPTAAPTFQNAKPHVEVESASESSRFKMDVTEPFTAQQGFGVNL